jgi:HAD superfamily hydrolase (TIGR01509 family)
MKPFSDFSALFFDLDGTLIAGSDQHFRDCVYETAKEFGCTEFVIPKAMMLTNFLREIFPEKDTAFYEEFIQKNKQRMLKTERRIAYFPDAEDFLHRTRSYKRALVTNCKDWELEMTFQKINLSEHFSEIVFRRFDHEGKPDPGLYIRAAELLCVDPSECLVFEDSEVGIAAGKNARMTVIALDRHGDIDARMADMVISDFSELFDYFPCSTKNFDG